METAEGYLITAKDPADEEVLAAGRELMQRYPETFKALAGLRDEGLLDSARARPRNAHSYNAKSSIAQLAASDAFGLAKNPPFVEGNKRAALLAPGVFPARNAYRLTASQREATTAIRRRAN